MPEDEHPPSAADDRSDSGERMSGSTDETGDSSGIGDSSSSSGGIGGGATGDTDDHGSNSAADFNVQVLARLAQLERAFGEQSARLSSIERRLGLVKHTPKPRPSSQDEPRASGTTGAEASARDDEANTPFGTPRAGAWRQEPAGAHDTHYTHDTHYAHDANTRGAHDAHDASTRDANARGATAAETDGEAAGILPARRDLEQMIGGSLFNWLGIIAVSLTVGFFLKYAFDNDWIGERGQVLLGAVVGVGILAAAERLRARGYRSYAYVLSGGGILILYLTVYAARVFYELVGVVPAFLLMIVVTTTAVLLAARYHAYAIAVLGLIGGFMTPALLSTGVDNQIGLFGYIALLNSGVLALAYFKRWRSLNHMAFVATVVTFGSWYVVHYEDWKLWRTLFFLTLFFLMFNALGVVYNVIKQRPARWFDISLIISNATLFFAASYALLEASRHSLLGSYALVLSAFYVILFYFTYQRNRADKLLALSYVGAAVTFFTIAAAIQLDQQWVTIAWAVEALMLTWIGLRSDADAPRYVALPVFAFALLRWFTVDVFEFAYREGDGFVPLVNRRA
ncbi:MAG: hypothetical protein QOE47_223, partial [Pyrinomonadaceae bacterium]|nr:hypothetical protein [Pyrinomonadaceae bacterium]